MRKLLWVGDAACDSGFARCTHQTLDVLRETWDVVVLGLNYYGEPHAYPYRIFPAFRPGQDFFGVKRLVDLVNKEQPALIVIQNDPWNIPAYMQQLVEYGGHVVGAIAVDGLNCRGRALNKLDRAIFWTRFGQEEAVKGGFTKPSGVVPLGVDLAIYTPGNRVAARRALGLGPVPDNAFIVGNVNRNQPRKRLDLTIAYFAEWVRERDIKDAYLYLHVAPTGDVGYNCEQLAAYHGIGQQDGYPLGRLILSEPEVFTGSSEAQLAATYQAFDVQLSTTHGEGWGLTTMEGMACGIPQIVPDWSALGEWPGDAVLKVPCTTTAANNTNVIGGVADKDATIATLDALYQSHHGQVWARYRQRGLELVRRPEYRWPAVGAVFAAELEKACA